MMTSYVVRIVVRIGIAAASVAVIASCNDVTDPRVPNDFLSGPASALEFTSTISKSVIQLGDTATVTFRLRNPTNQTVRLSFSMACPVLPYVSAGDNYVVYPSGGSWACAASISNLNLAPQGEHVLRLPVRGGAPTASVYFAAALGPGSYVAYAELTDDQGRSKPVTFSIVK